MADKKTSKKYIACVEYRGDEIWVYFGSHPGISSGVILSKDIADKVGARSPCGNTAMLSNGTIKIGSYDPIPCIPIIK